MRITIEVTGIDEPAQLNTVGLIAKEKEDLLEAVRCCAIEGDCDACPYDKDEEGKKVSTKECHEVLMEALRHALYGRPQLPHN